MSNGVPKNGNPFDYLGVTYSADGKMLTMHEVKDDKWVEYEDIDGSASFTIDPLNASFWGKGFKLSHFYKAYLWNKDNGYENFESWIE